MKKKPKRKGSQQPRVRHDNIPNLERKPDVDIHEQGEWCIEPVDRIRERWAVMAEQKEM